jgi:colicin import membrane protein
MLSYLKQRLGSISLSTGLHIAIVAALTLGLSFSGEPRYPISTDEPVAIEATVVDEALIQREMERLEEIQQAEIQRQQEQERLAREQAEEARRQAEAEQARLEEQRREREQAAQIEEQRLADLQLQREEAERQVAEAERQRIEEEQRLAAEREAEAERQRQLEEQRRQEEEQRQREEQERLAREAEEARVRAEMEAELQRVLAQEDERRRAEESGLLDEYIRLIVNRIEQNWIRPASARPGLECQVRVTQIPSGDIVDVQVRACNGDEAVIRSIEAAVLNSSPLPRPTVPSLFERTLNVIFAPEV